MRFAKALGSFIRLECSALCAQVISPATNSYKFKVVSVDAFNKELHPVMNSNVGKLGASSKSKSLGFYEGDRIVQVGLDTFEVSRLLEQIIENRMERERSSIIITNTDMDEERSLLE